MDETYLEDWIHAEADCAVALHMQEVARTASNLAVGSGVELHRGKNGAARIANIAQKFDDLTNGTAVSNISAEVPTRSGAHLGISNLTVVDKLTFAARPVEVKSYVKNQIVVVPQLWEATTFLSSAAATGATTAVSRIYSLELCAHAPDNTLTPCPELITDPRPYGAGHELLVQTGNYMSDDEDPHVKQMEDLLTRALAWREDEPLSA